MDGGRGRGPEGWVLLLSEGGGRVQRQKCEREGEAAAFIMTSAHHQRNGNGTATRLSSATTAFFIPRISDLFPGAFPSAWLLEFFSDFRFRGSQTHGSERQRIDTPGVFSFGVGNSRPGGVYTAIAASTSGMS